MLRGQSQKQLRRLWSFDRSLLTSTFSTSESFALPPPAHPGLPSNPLKHISLHSGYNNHPFNRVFACSPTQYFAKLDFLGALHEWMHSYLMLQAFCHWGKYLIGCRTPVNFNCMQLYGGWGTSFPYFSQPTCFFLAQPILLYSVTPCIWWHILYLGWLLMVSQAFWMQARACSCLGESLPPWHEGPCPDILVGWIIMQMIPPIVLDPHWMLCRMVDALICPGKS